MAPSIPSPVRVKQLRLSMFATGSILDGSGSARPSTAAPSRSPSAPRPSEVLASRYSRTVPASVATVNSLTTDSVFLILHWRVNVSVMLLILVLLLVIGSIAAPSAAAFPRIVSSATLLASVLRGLEYDIDLDILFVPRIVLLLLKGTIASAPIGFSSFATMVAMISNISDRVYLHE